MNRTSCLNSMSSNGMCMRNCNFINANTLNLPLKLTCSNDRLFDLLAMDDFFLKVFVPYRFPFSLMHQSLFLFLNNLFALFFDKGSCFFMYNRLMYLVDVLLVNDWLVNLMNERLQMLVQYHLMVFMNHIFVMFMNYVLMNLSDNRLFNMLFDNSSFLMLLDHSAFINSIDSCFFLMLNYCGFLLNSLINSLVAFDHVFKQAHVTHIRDYGSCLESCILMSVRVFMRCKHVQFVKISSQSRSFLADSTFLSIVDSLFEVSIVLALEKEDLVITITYKVAFSRFRKSSFVIANNHF